MPAAPKSKPAKAKKTPRSQTAAPDVRSAAARSDNPMDWLFDNPLGSYPDFVFAILKPSYNGFPNSAAEFGGRKLRPVIGRDGDGAPDQTLITAFRYGAVLPCDAPDALDEPEVLLRSIDAATTEHAPALLIYLTLSFPDATRAHHAWEEARAFSLGAFARERQLPVCLIQHRPGDAGSDNPVHVHLLISARRLDGLGFRGYVTELLCDQGQQIIYDEWIAFRSKWAP